MGATRVGDTESLLPTYTKTIGLCTHNICANHHKAQFRSYTSDHDCGLSLYICQIHSMDMPHEHNRTEIRPVFQPMTRKRSTACHLAMNNV